LKILLENNELILLDEPYLKIDDEFITKFNYHIKNMIKENNKTIIISSSKSFSRYKIIKILFKIADGKIVKIDKPRSTLRKNYKNQN